MTALYRFIPHSQFDAALTCGWIFVSHLSRPHGDYSALFRACCCNEFGEFPNRNRVESVA